MEKAKFAHLVALVLINCCFQLTLSNEASDFLLHARAPFPPTVDIYEICDGVFFEARPFPGNNQFFIGCIRGGGVILQCRENELFDENELKCMATDTTTAAATTTTTTAEPPNYDALCEGLFFDFIPHPTDCGQTIFCYEQQPVVRDCPLGTIFDIIAGGCRPGNRDTCLLYEAPATNVPVETTTEADLTGICDGIDLGFREHPSDCGIAIFCFNQEAVLRECPQNEIFDIQFGICRPGNRDTCLFYDDAPTTTDSPDLGEICMEKEEDQFIEHPTDCGKAIFCFNQSPILRECPDNTIFDLPNTSCRAGNRETCTFYSRQDNGISSNGNGFVEHSNPCEGLSDNVNKLQIIISLAFVSLVAQTAAQNPCSGVWGGLVPNPNDCTKYYLCVIFMAFEQSCASGEIFDVPSLSCVLGNPETCEPIFVTNSTTELPPPVTTPAASTTTSEIAVSTPPTTLSTTPLPTSIPSTTTPPTTIPEICRNVFFAARPHPNSNRLFIGCIRGDGTIFQCFQDEIFDPRVNECVEECKVSEDICKGRGFEIIVNPCECTRYIVCLSEAIISEGQCAPNEVFSAVDNACRPGNTETCEVFTENTVTATEPEIPTASTVPSNPCEGVLFGNVPHESDCTMFYRCLNHQASPQRCPANQRFDTVSNSCEVGSC